MAGAVVVALLGGWLIYRTTGAGGTSQPKASPTPTVVITTGPPTPGPHPATSKPKTSAPKSELLTDLHPVAKGEGGVFGDTRYLDTGNGTVNDVSYPFGHALVSHTDFGDNTACNGYSEYNLSKQWKSLNMAVGIDDNSKYHAATITVTLDNKTLYKGVATIGKTPAAASPHRWPAASVCTSEHRLREAGCAEGKIVVGNPTLTR